MTDEMREAVKAGRIISVEASPDGYTVSIIIQTPKGEHIILVPLDQHEVSLLINDWYGVPNV